MRNTRNPDTPGGAPRSCAVALPLALAALIAASPTHARAPVEVRSPAVAATSPRPEAAFEIREGRVSSFDLRRGVLVVDGIVHRVDSATTAFSDDRRERPKGGLASLRPGDKVIVRAVRIDGLIRATQLIARD